MKENNLKEAARLSFILESRQEALAYWLEIKAARPGYFTNEVDRHIATCKKDIETASRKIKALLA